jgi:serine phosphatase RsbU (regulator of sigma subunit)
MQRRFFETQRELLTMEQELQTARRIQSFILPASVPQLSGLEIAVRYRPMNAVAGDWYDFHVFDQECLGLLVADVSGHGVAAALIASMAKMSFAFNCSRSRHPVEILSGLNHNLRDTPPEQFVTAACATIDLEKRLLLYGGAGHPPTFLWRSRVRELLPCHSEGGILGAFPSMHYHEQQFAIRPGDRLIFYTDGITEAANGAGIQFGEERLREYIQNVQGMHAERFADFLIENLERWCGDPIKEEPFPVSFQDDITLLIVDVH